MKKGLIVRQPWLDLILSGQKIYEMRSRQTKIRGEIGLIQAGSGLVMGTCKLVNCSFLTPAQAKECREFHQIRDDELLAKYRYAWHLKDARRFHEPRYYEHPRGAVVWVNL